MWKRDLRGPQLKGLSLKGLGTSKMDPLSKQDIGLLKTDLGDKASQTLASVLKDRQKKLESKL